MARLFLVLLLSVVFVAPAGASTGPFAEAPVSTLPGEPSCLAATGAPGELVLGETFTTQRVRFVHATHAGATAGPTLDVPGCGPVAARPNGAGVVAGTTGASVIAAAREPGGAWGISTTLGRPRGEARALSAAVSDRGEALVAWAETLRGGGSRVRVARRLPGGDFATLASFPAVGAVEAIDTGVAANGDAFVLYTTRENALPPFRATVRVATALASGAMGAPVKLAETPWRSTPALAVSQDGHALVAIADGETLSVAERAPGAPFGATVRVAAARDATGVRTRAVLGDGGQAAILWQGVEQHGVQLLSRRGPGAFAAPVVLAKPKRAGADDPFWTSESFETTFAASGSYLDDPVPALAFAGVDRVILAGVGGRGAELITAALGAGAVARDRLPASVFPPRTPVALTLDDGAPAIAYAGTRTGSETELHLGTVGAVPGVERPPPTVRIRAPKELVLSDHQFRLPITCSGPCDVYGELVGRPEVTGVANLQDAGKTDLVFYDLDPLARVRGGRIRIRLTYGAPDAHTLRTRIVSVRLRVTAEAPEPRVLALKAVRRGSTIRVTWRTDRPLGQWVVGWVSGATTRTWSGEPLDVVQFNVRKRDERTFSATLTHRTAAMRWVSLYIGDHPDVARIK